MSNKNYQAGRRLEYKVRKTLLDKGWTEVMRTAGSHGSADLIAINKLGFIVLIQCKKVQTEAEGKRLVSNFIHSYEKSNEEASRVIIVYVSKTRSYLIWSNGVEVNIDE